VFLSHITEMKETPMPCHLEKCAFDDVNERQLFLLDLDDPDAIPENFELGSPYFGCLLVLDATRVDTQELLSVVRPLIDAGCVYFCCWGTSCEWVHDVIDEIDPHHAADPNTVIMTTWHNDEPLKETIWFFLNTMWPDPKFENSFDASIAVIIGSKEWAATVRAALKQPREFSEAWLNDEAAELKS